MSKIIDNVQTKLADQLAEVLPHSLHLDACVGYFNLRGWQQIRSKTASLTFRENGEPPIRLLVGMALSEDRELRQQLLINNGVAQGGIDLGRAMKLVKDALEGFVKQLTWGLPSSQDMQGLKELRDDLANDRLIVKFAARHPLHAKLYVCHLSGGLGGFRATVGSSNLTSAGLGNQGELNLEETDQQTTSELAAWFEKNWNDQFTIDITEELIQVIDESWAQIPQPSPHLLHLRLAYELSRDARNGLLLDIPEHVRKDLLPHQESAVRVATQMLERKGLAVIGDVVGLGKTLSGTAIAASIGETVLVICPKNLVKMWKSVLDHYSVPSNVISLSMVTKELPNLRRYRLLLVDESHNLRHKSRQDWQAIRSYIELNDPMVILMTATMFNANHQDISDQLALKIDPDQDLGMRPEKLIEEIGELELAARTNGKLTTLEAFNRSEFVEDWQRLLSQFLIRRTRRFLESNYGELDPDTQRVKFKFPNGEEFSFPKRKAEPLAYLGGENDPGEQLASEENFRKISKMTYARYQLGEYLKPSIKGETAEEIKFIEDLIQSTTSAAGFIRTTVFKRLASSPHAFLKTIDRMLLKNRLLEYALENGDSLPVGSYSEFGITLEGDDLDPESDLELDDENEVSDIQFHGEKNLLIYGKISSPEAVKFSYTQLLEKNPRGIKWMRSELFDREKLLKALGQDSAYLQSLIDEFGKWDPNADSKLDSLEGLINSLGENEKVLVFSEYADTVDYVHNSLSHRLQKRTIEKASSKTTDPTELARRFSPISNADLGGLPPSTTEIDVLVTTDVLSEGQNLQDCAIVVNWDMPWTIIKIIQRAGRVDRVGQKSPTIRVLTFLAQDAVEEKIKNLGRLKARLNAAKEIFGLDDDFFNDQNDFDFVDGLFDGSADLIGDEGDVDYASFALGIWNSCTEKDQQDALRLGLGVHSSLANASEEQVMIYCQTSSGYDVLQRVLTKGDNANQPHSITPIEALKNSECKPGTSAGQELENHHELVELAFKEGVVKQLNQAVVLANSGVRKRLYKFLSDFREDHKDNLYSLTGTEDVMDQLLKAPIQKSCEKTLVDLLRHANKSNDNVHVVNRILEMYHAGELLDLDVEKGSIPHLVLSMALGVEGAEKEIGERLV